MRTILSILIFSGMLSAEDRRAVSGTGPVANVQAVTQDPTVTALIAEVANLKAQLAKLQIRFQYEMRICAMPDMMKAELLEQETGAALQKSKEAAKPKDDGK